MTRILVSVATAISILFSVAIAGDAPLSADQAKRFVDSLPALEAFSEEMMAKESVDVLAIETTPKAGEPFKPYTKAVAALKETHPAEHARLGETVKPHGFTPEEWGSVGDRVMVAYMALKMQEEDPRALEMMAGMDDPMIAMMPPEMRAQMEGVYAMMETIKNAPEPDRIAVATVKPRLDAYMEEAPVTP